MLRVSWARTKGFCHIKECLVNGPYRGSDTMIPEGKVSLRDFSLYLLLPFMSLSQLG